MRPKADLEPAVSPGPAEAADATAAAPDEGRRRPRAGRRRIRRLTTRDRVVITVLLGLPLLFTFVLVWATTLASIGLSFASPLWAKLSWALIGLVRPAAGLFADRSVDPSAPLSPRTHRAVPGGVRPSRRGHLRRHRAVRRGE